MKETEKVSDYELWNLEEKAKFSSWHRADAKKVVMKLINEIKRLKHDLANVSGQKPNKKDD